jgi:hypothetical protein
MKYRYFLVMNSIYDQVYRNPFKVSDIKGLKVGAILVALKSMNLIKIFFIYLSICFFFLKF